MHTAVIWSRRAFSPQTGPAVLAENAPLRAKGPAPVNGPLEDPRAILKVDWAVGIHQTAESAGGWGRAQRAPSAGGCMVCGLPLVDPSYSSQASVPTIPWGMAIQHGHPNLTKLDCAEADFSGEWHGCDVSFTVQFRLRMSIPAGKTFFMSGVSGLSILKFWVPCRHRHNPRSACPPADGVRAWHPIHNHGVDRPPGRQVSIADKIKDSG